MDNIIIKNYFMKEVRRNLLSKKFLLYFSIVLTTNFWVVYLYSKNDNNCWNPVFFVLGNRYIYILFFISSFLIYFSFFNNENYFSLLRLKSKKNWMKSRILINLFAVSFHTIMFFMVLIILSISIHGFDSTWSQSSLTGLDIYTNFSNIVSPYQAVLLYFVRFFGVLLLLSGLFIMLRIITNSIQKSYTVISIYLLTTIVFNMSNVPYLKMLDISNNYLYVYSSSFPIIQFLVLKNIHLIFIFFIEIFISYRFIRGVQYNCQKE